MTEVTHGDLAVALHDVDLDVLGARLNDFEQALDRELDGLVPRQVVLVVLFEEFADGFGGPTNSVCLQIRLSYRMGTSRCRPPLYLPCTVDASRLSLVEPGSGVVGVETDDEGRHSEWPDTSRLCVFL